MNDEHSQCHEDDFFFFFSDADLIFNTGTGNTPSPADNDRFPPERHIGETRAQNTHVRKRHAASLICAAIAPSATYCLQPCVLNASCFSA